MSCKEICTDREKRLSLCALAHVNVCTQWSHMCMRKYIFSTNNSIANLRINAQERIKRIILQHRAYYGTFRVCTSFPQPWAGPYTCCCSQAWCAQKYAATAITMLLASFSPPLYNTYSDPSSAWVPFSWIHSHSEGILARCLVVLFLKGTSRVCF